MNGFNQFRRVGASTGVLFLTLLQTFCSPSFSQDEEPLFSHGVLWSIQAPESDQISYLFGTVHTMDTNHIRLPLGELEQLADVADIVCTESVNPNGAELSAGKHPKNMFKLMMLKDTTRTISNSLDSSSRHRLSQILDQSKGQAKWMKVMIPMIKPSVLAFMLQMELQTRSPLYESDNFSPEAHFSRRAKESGKQLAGLETYGDVSKALFESTNFDEDMEVLKTVIEEYDNPDRSDLFINYSKQDLKSIAGEFSREEAFVRRNETMVSSIDRLIAGNSLFVMVGAAHLPGESGVLNLLKEKGYKVKNIPVALATVR